MVINNLGFYDQKSLSLAIREMINYLHLSGVKITEKNLLNSLEISWRAIKPYSKVTVVTAHPLSVLVKQSLLQKIQGAQLKLEVNSQLIGGAIIRVDQERIDGSVIGALSRLKQRFLTQV
jgi:hypothetical protein